jgi:addiction module RelE/StbE family toxin
MTIIFTKGFDKQFVKLPKVYKDKFKERIAIFRSDPFDEGLRNHALKGKYIGYRSIDIAGDLRALYKVEGDTVYIFYFIGSHSQLYG